MEYSPRLKDRGYYENRYDELVVSQCRMVESVHESVLKQSLEKKGLSYGPEEVRRQCGVMSGLDLYFRK